jgi:tetratricopeptide (TPR) repeat protein
MRISKLAACLAPLFLTAAMAQTTSRPNNMPSTPREPAAFKPEAGASAPAPSNVVRPEVGKPLLEAQTLLGEKKLPQVKEKLQAANSVPDKTAYENYVISRVTLSAAITEDDAATAEKMLNQVLQLSQEGGGWLKPEDNLQLTQAVGIVNYRTKNYAAAATWLERFLKAGGVSDNARALRVQAMFLGGDYQKVIDVIEAENAQTIKDGKLPTASYLEILGQAYDRKKDLVGSSRALEMLIKHYPKKEYWQSLLARLGAKPDFASRLQLDLLRLSAHVGALVESNDYSEYVDFAQRAGYSAEALKAYEQGAAAGLLGSGANAAVDAKQRARLVQESEQDRKSADKEAAAAAKRPDGTSMLRVGMNLVGLGQADKGLELMEKGIAKGGLKRPDDAWLDLGIAYAMAGKNDKAEQAFTKVSGKEGLEELGRYWLLAIRKP